MTEEFLVSKLKPRYGVTRGVVAEASGNSTAQQSSDMSSLAVDLYVAFAFGSANLAVDGEHLLEVVSNALKSPELQSLRFEIAGHTDAIGSAAFNQRLSERRAQSVRMFLVRYGKIDGSRLIAKGYGKARLKDPAAPDSSINRRVEISTLDH